MIPVLLTETATANIRTEVLPDRDTLYFQPELTIMRPYHRSLVPIVLLVTVNNTILQDLAS